MSGRYVVITAAGQRFPARNRRDAYKIAVALSRLRSVEDWVCVTGPWKRAHR